MWPGWRESLLVVASVGLALALVDGALRLADEPHVTPYEHDPLLGWRHKADHRGRLRAAEFDTSVRTNARRMRESDAVPAATTGVRVAVLGDSFVWGHGVEEAERLTEGAAARLGPGWEILNFGVGGYGTDQQALQLERDVLPLRPRVVVVVFFLNDLVDVTRAASHQAVPKPRFVLEGEGLRLTGVPVRRVAGWDRPPEGRWFGWHLLDQLRRVRAFVRRAAQRPEDAGFLNPAHLDLLAAEREPRRALLLHERLCRRMRDRTAENGSVLVLAEAPFKEYFASDRDLGRIAGRPRAAYDLERSRRHLRGVAADLGVAYLDPYPAFLADGGIANFYRADQHLNARGHAVMAGVLADGLAGMRRAPPR